MSIAEIKKITRNTLMDWKDVFGFAPDSVANILEEARLDWIIELTDCLQIWIEKDQAITQGELLLARANIGAVVEGWLKFFYCVYYEDYIKKPRKDKNGKTIDPNNLTFEALKQFSREILWKLNDEWDKWVESVQKKRNAIHAFNDREIGTPSQFLEDVDKLLEYINLIIYRLPDISEHPRYNCW